MSNLKQYIRSIPDFPKPGITFYDITTLIQHPKGLELALDGMETYVRRIGADRVVGIESRGFVFGAALADRLDLGLSIARKPGKLPSKTITEAYELEYGTDRLEMHEDSIQPGEKVVVVDDLIATGGTLLAVCRMVERLKGEVVGISSVIGLTFLPFAEKLKGYDLDYLVSYDSE
ncbi:MAG: adenine phosphoribosyltransferase [candidate division Zixibacteria bacterium]|nr:adenine phosphoribosyltransferase [candidate division Zixibacteria bacterium]